MWNPKLEKIWSCHDLCNKNWQYYLLYDLWTKLYRKNRFVWILWIMLSPVYPSFCCFSIKLLNGSVAFLFLFLDIVYTYVMLGMWLADITLSILPLSCRTSWIARLGVLPSLNLRFNSSLMLGYILLLPLGSISFPLLENSYAAITKSSASLKTLILRPVAFLFELNWVIMNLLKSS